MTSHLKFLSRIEQTATLRVDNGPIATGASPGKLRQLNGNGQLFVGKILIFLNTVFENLKKKSHSTLRAKRATITFIHSRKNP